MKKRRILFAALILALACFFSLVLLLSADEEDIFMVLDDFSDPLAWSALGEAAEVSGTEFEGTACLLIDGTAVPEGSYIGAQRSGYFTDSQEECFAVVFSVYLVTEDGSRGDFSLSASVEANGSSHTATTGLVAGEWSKIVIRIGSFPASSLSSVKIRCDAVSSRGDVYYTLLISPVTAGSSRYEQITERFFCGYYEGHNAELSYGADGARMNVTTGNGEAFAEGGAIAAFAEGSVNALRLDVASCSRTCDMTISWSYSSDGGFEAGDSYTFTAERSALSRVYIVPVPDLWNITRLKISFSASRVSVSFNSVLAVSAYSAPENTYGDISSCAVSPDGRYIIIKGTMKGGTVTKYKGCKLGLYELDARDDISVVGELTYGPSAEIDITTKFEFRLPLKASNYMSVFSKYAVAVCKDGAPVIPLVMADTPCFTDNISALSGVRLSREPSNLFKGISSPADLSYTGAGSAVIDVDLTKLISLKNTGYPHEANGKYYYYNDSYTDSVDALVKAYSLRGGRVILRLLVTNPGKEVPFAYSYNQSGVMYYAANASSSQGQAYLHAAVDFLCKRYAKEDMLVSGFALGMCADRAGEYNFMGYNVPLADYAEKYLMALRVVYGTAMRVNSGVSVYVPISDSWQNDSVGLRFLYPDYDNALLLEALCAGASNEGGAVFSVIVESDKPSYLTAFSDTQDFSAFYKKLSGVFPVLRGNPFYIWDPSGNENSEEVCASYAMLYYGFLFAGNADGFAVVCRGRVSRLTELLKQIDTVGTLNASVRYLKLLGIEDATRLPAYDPARAVLRDCSSGSFSFNIPSHAGVFTYIEPSGFEAGSGILSASLSEGVYKAFLDPDSEQHSVVRSFSPHENMTLTGFLGFSVYVELANNTEAEVEITVGGENSARTFTYKTEGGGQSLYADISDFNAASSVKYIIIRVFAPGVKAGSVSIGPVEGYSSLYASPSLAKAVEKLRADAARTGTGLFTSPVFWTAMVVVLITVSAVTALYSGKNKRV